MTGGTISVCRESASKRGLRWLAEGGWAIGGGRWAVSRLRLLAVLRSGVGGGEGEEADEGENAGDGRGDHGQ